MQLNIHQWKEFKYEEIFIIKNGFYNKKPLDLAFTSKTNLIPFIGASDSNNGVTSWHTLDQIEEASKTGDGVNHPLEKKLFQGNCITVSNNGSVGYAFYQRDEFTCSHDINVLYLKNYPLNSYLALFICGIIGMDKYRWQYGRKWRPIRMPSSIIKLPITNEGIPDWQFMEDYIKSLPSYELLEKIIKKSLSGTETPFLNIPQWKEFKLSDLFDIKRGTFQKKPEEGGKIPFIGATDSNNGVTDYIYSNREPSSGNVITVSNNGSIGYAFYQKNPFYSSSDISILSQKNNLMTELSAMFICSIFPIERYRFSYGFKWSLERMKETHIKLPTTNEGTPDWQFMEDYIKSLPYSANI